MPEITHAFLRFAPCFLLSLLTLLPVARSVASEPVSPEPATTETQSATPPAAPAEPTERETVARALQDLQADSPDRRKGAVMLLAKYPRNPLARRGLRTALQDPAAVVRRAAAVSLIEDSRSLGPPEARNLLLALKDPDPEVRLSVASSIENLLLQWRRFQTGSATNGKARQVQEAVLGALTDEQALVRQRILEGLRLYPRPVPREAMVSAMQDPVVPVRMAAYESASRLLDSATFAREAARLHPDPNARVRLLLANLIARRPDAAAVPLLRELAADEDPRVAALAHLTVYLIIPQDPIPEEIREQLRRGELDSTLQQRLLLAVRSLPTDLQRQELRFFLDQGPARLARQAAQYLLRSYSAFPPTGLLLDLLRHGNGSVRSTALRFLQRPPNGGSLPAELLRAIPDLPHSDVRRRLPELARSSAPELQTELALQLLIDEEPAVRIAALRALARLQPPQWPRIRKASLRDPDPAVQAVARQLDAASPTP